MTALNNPTPKGELRAAMIGNPFACHLWEVFAHPETADELLSQSAAGILKVNGKHAAAHIVDRLGNGDVIVRITTDISEMRLEAIA